MILRYSSEGYVASVSVRVEGNFVAIPINLRTYEVEWHLLNGSPHQDEAMQLWDEWVEGKDLAHEFRHRPDKSIL